MSSLLQHHGGRSVDGRKVELLMYLVRDVEVNPLRCMECGHHWHGERTCAKCGRFVLFVREHHPDRTSVDLLDMETAMTFPEYAQVKSSDRTTTVANWWSTVDAEPVELTRPDGSTSRCARLYRIYRRPVGMWGCWVVFRYNGEEHVPDLSVPIAVHKLPRDAEPLTDAEAAAYWFTP